MTGLTVAVHGLKNEVPTFAYLDDSLQWSSFAFLAPAATATTFEVVFDKEGTGYIAYQTSEGIALFKVGLEEDVLPE